MGGEGGGAGVRWAGGLRGIREQGRGGVGGGAGAATEKQSERQGSFLIALEVVCTRLPNELCKFTFKYAKRLLFPYPPKGGGSQQL